MLCSTTERHLAYTAENTLYCPFLHSACRLHQNGENCNIDPPKNPKDQEKSKLEKDPGAQKGSCVIQGPGNTEDLSSNPPPPSFLSDPTDVFLHAVAVPEPLKTLEIQACRGGTQHRGLKLV